ncbi:MAG: SDR family oxidoreductase, partial [Gemmatales bacterium]|nr:SDR family oxidoreductase [Gemmatales bacterium]MDW8385788.1 SDR family oxidoreductase [Gemmatales bacterium]
LEQAGLVGLHLGDASDTRDVDRTFAAVAEQLGGLDVLFHVAGGSGRKHGDGPLDECTDAGWEYTLRLNLTSVFLTNRAAIRMMRKQRSGVILNLASVLAFAPAPPLFDTVGYTAAKGGVISLSRLAAARYAAEGIRVNVIAPGLVDTPMAQRALGDPAIMAFVRDKQPLTGGACPAQAVAKAAVFLASDEAACITGAVIHVDAGWSVC